MTPFAIRLDRAGGPIAWRAYDTRAAAMRAAHAAMKHENSRSVEVWAGHRKSGAFVACDMLTKLSRKEG